MPQKKCLVLLVVADVRISHCYKLAFRAAGFHVRRVPDLPPDLPDLDPEVIVVQLPVSRRASDVATRLRAQSRLEPIVLVGLSPHSNFDSERSTGRQSGFDDVLPLSVHSEALLWRVVQLLEMRPPLRPCIPLRPPAA
jgi:DNA-binding response OmpR family regulator